MLSIGLFRCGPVERCLVIARWRVSVGQWPNVFGLYRGQYMLCTFDKPARGCRECTVNAATGLLVEADRCLYVEERTQAEVVAAFDAAILLARARGV